MDRLGRCSNAPVRANAALGGPVGDPIENASFCTSWACRLLYRPQVTRSPMPLKRSMPSPTPHGQEAGERLQVGELAVGRGAEML